MELFCAVSENNIEKVKEVLIIYEKMETLPDEILDRWHLYNYSQNSGVITLMIACENNNLEIVKLLLETKMADVSYYNNYDENTIDIAKRHTNQEMSKLVDIYLKEVQ